MNDEMTAEQREWSERQAHLERVAAAAWEHGYAAGRREAIDEARAAAQKTVNP